MFIIEMFRQAFHTYGQNWKKLIFFSVGIGLTIDIIAKYIITYWGYRILAVPFTPSSSIGDYVFSHFGTALPPLVYLLALFNSVLYVVAPIFYILPILYLLIYPEPCQFLTPLDIFKKTAPFRKSIMLIYLFNFIFEPQYSFTDATYPEITFFFFNINLNLNLILLLALSATIAAVIIVGMEFIIVKDGLTVLSSLKAVCKIFSRRFFSTLLLVALMRLFHFFLLYFFLPLLSTPEVLDSHFTYFMRLVFDAFYYPLELYSIYYALFQLITKKETNITP